MKITYDPAKRLKALIERGMDFEDAQLVFQNPVYEFEDNRKEYGELRMRCYGTFYGRVVMICYTQRGDERQIISMRKANEREIREFGTKISTH